MTFMDEAAFTLIVENTKQIVLSTIRKYIFTEHLSSIDDIVQETYLRAYKSLSRKKFRHEAKISSWLYVIARNETIRMNQRLSRQTQITRKYQDMQDPEITWEELDIDKLLAPDLEEIIAGLSEKYRQVFRFYLQGYDENAIATELSLPRGTIKSRLHRAKNQLRKSVERRNL
ncbi:MAG: RNA polymerase sigma factor [Candidatus Cloacimonetes bacterium]|nr:RNA polymerase sigma factor [Candidatus Cloacimonadota bacterium]